MRHFLLLPLFVQVAVAQQPPSTPDRDQIIQQLLERVQQLENEVRQLKQQRATPAEPPAADVPPAAGQGQAMAGMPPDPTAGLMNLQIRGFSDVSFHASDLRRDTDSFALGQFNLFITSRISDQMSVLAEAVMEADERNGIGIDLERMLLQYTPSDYFNVSFGRYHTAIGWYNTAYHHSTWMQTATGRPLLFEFEDKGGILPVHNVGISASGRIPSGSMGLRYVAEVGNGRASRDPFNEEPVLNVRDDNNGKAVNFALLARPDRLAGFQAGVSVYHDNLTPDGRPNVGEYIFAVHAVYQGPSFEWLNEGVVIRNAIRGTELVDHTPGFYTQLSRKLGRTRPYFRYQYINVPARDPIFPDLGLFHGPSVGVRYDLGEFVAFKVQYDHFERRQASPINGITTQLAFTF